MQKKLESQLVRLVMSEASEDEIEEATRRWFGFLLTVDRIVREREQGERDSSGSGSDGNLEAISHNL